jgi:dolichol-phosphate mannosyltransferase
MSTPEISVVIPAHNEAENLEELLPEIRAALADRAYEIVVVDDGSSDRTAEVAEALGSECGPVRVIRHARSLGKSAGLWTGVRAASAEIVATLDGDGQNDPAFIPALVAPLIDPAIGLAAGRRIGRKDTLAKKIASRIANGVRRSLLHDLSSDTGCGATAFRREAFVRLPYFDTNHRFLPALFLADGWNVVEVDVVDRPRQHGTSHYGILDRLVVGIPDLFGVRWLTRRRRRSPFGREGKSQ